MKTEDDFITEFYVLQEDMLPFSVTVFVIINVCFESCYAKKYAAFNKETETIEEYGDIKYTDFFTPTKMRYFESFDTVFESKLPFAVIDMSKAESEPYKVASQIINALETVGFMYLKNIPGFTDEKLLELTQWFFELPVSYKRNVTRKKWNMKSNHVYRGYFPVIPEWTSYKEGFEVGGFEGTKNTSSPGNTLRDTLQEPNIWPNGTNTQEAQYFKISMKEYFNMYDELSQNITKLVALGLGIDESVMASLFQPKPLSTLRLIHYPPRPSHHIPPDAMDDNIILHCDKHADSGFMTFLSTFSYKGLQIFKNNQWIDVPPVKNTLIVNIGLNMAAISGGRFKATIHRVIDLGRNRYSVAFFMEPHYDAIVSRTLWDIPIKGVQENTKYGPWVFKSASKFAEYADMDWGTA